MVPVLVRFPDFRRFFAGSSVSLLGSSVTTVALPLTAVAYLHASAAQMGVLGALALAPHLVLGLPAGVWVDRLPYRRLLVATNLGQAVVLGTVPVLAACGLLRLWHLYVVILLAGLGSLFETVTAQSYLPCLVPREQLLTANGALAMSNAAVNTSGSAVGGLLVTLLTAPIAIAVDAFSFVVAAFFTARVRAYGGGRPKRPLAAGVFRGIHTVFRHPVLRALILAATIGAMCNQMQMVILVIYLVRDLGLPAGLVGIVIAAGGAAGVLGALVTGWFTRRSGPGAVVVAGMALTAAAGVVLAAATGPVLVAFAIAVLAQMLRGVGPSLYGVNQQTLRQSLISADRLSGANATWRFLVYGMQALGALLGGLLGSALGLRTTLLIASVGILAGTVLAAGSPLRTFRVAPEN
ncbi:MFS transporter [Fodinicola acaciae]|uniref:MFS transporter n=1 Tax=Fodinicola acaciae TaxID=2681555 RepID=UPI0013D85DBE|nr:MFS transporter [Fodinicola acaciae]